MIENTFCQSLAVTFPGEWLMAKTRIPADATPKWHAFP
jgi:hypothetical protein